jgi:hypothetical protein
MPDRPFTVIDLDIRIFKAGGTYLVTAQHPASGLAESTLDVDALFDEAFQEKLRQIREEPFTTSETLFREVGDVLFHALFQGQVRDLFLAIWSQHVQASDAGAVRLRLNIAENAIELATLPWEMLHWQDVFLGTQISTLVTRQLLNLSYGNIQSLAVQGVPRVLIVIPGGSGLDTTAEETAITATLDKTGVPYDVLRDQVTLQRLDDALTDGDYAILHFIGHAKFGLSERDEMHGTLRFNGPGQGTAAGTDEDWATETDLQSLLGNHKGLKLVVLNSCHTAEISSRGDQPGFWGVIPSLLRAGIPAVVAMQYAIRDDIAALFGETFYKRLTSDKWAGHVDIAVTLARNSCFLAYPDDRGFAPPPLYLRSKDGVIFRFQAEEDDSVQPVTAPAEAHCEKAPEPPERLLYRYRNADLETLLQRLPLLNSRLQRLTFQIDELRAAEELDGQQLWRLQQYEKNRTDLEREIDELLDVLAWRKYQACLEMNQLAAQLAAKQREREALEQAGAYVSYELKNDIFKKSERLLKLRELLNQDIP